MQFKITVRRHVIQFVNSQMRFKNVFQRCIPNCNSQYAIQKTVEHYMTKLHFAKYCQQNSKTCISKNVPTK